MKILMRLTLVLSLAAMSCGEYENSTDGVFVWDDSEPTTSGKHSDELCIIRDRDSLVELRPRYEELLPPCEEGYLREELDVNRETPFMVSLTGLPGVEYCAQILRESGYLTISHRTGSVRREGDVFTWCVTPTDYTPEMILLRSLTEHVRCTLVVP